MKYIPLHELERQVLNMPRVPSPPYETGLMMDGKGNVVENPDYRQPVATVEIKHDLFVKWYGAQFHASDYRLHELALDFEFFEFGSKEKQPQPWALRDSHISKQHIFFSQLKREATSTSFDGILDRFSRISQQTFYDIADDMPKSWVIESSVRKILSHVCLVHDNVDKFRQGLLEALT